MSDGEDMIDPEFVIDDEFAEELPVDDVESDGAQHRRFLLKRDIKRRLDRYLRSRLPGLSRSRLQKLINEGAVTVNEGKPKSSTMVKQGDVIDILVPPPAFKRIPPEDIPLQVLFEDDYLIVLNKQANLVVHPARSNQTGTMVNALSWYFRTVEQNGLESLSNLGVKEFRPGIVHRLDKDTTGAIIVAKTDAAHSAMGRQFEKRTIQKYYLAIVHGEMKEAGGVIDQPIGKHKNVHEAYAVRNDSSGRDSVTLFRVREVFDGYSLVELELKTGRTHQIRVHLTWMGHPIISDIIYGGEPMGETEFATPPEASGSQPMLTFARTKEEGVKIWKKIDEREDILIGRPALHATVLEFDHPVTGARIEIQAPLHEDMKQILERLRNERRKSGPLKAQGAVVDLDRL